MTTITFDTFELTESLKKVGIPAAQAEAAVRSIAIGRDVMHVPNQETADVLRKSELGQELTAHPDLGSLFNHLNRIADEAHQDQ